VSLSNCTSSAASSPRGAESTASDAEGASDDEDHQGFNPVAILAKVAMLMLVFALLCVFLEWAAGPAISKFSKTFVENTGPFGLFAMVWFLDGFPTPFTYVPLIYLSVKGGVSRVEVGGICGLASYTAAIMGYCIGFNIRKSPCAASRLDGLIEKHPEVLKLMQERGGIGVAMAALLPVPLALATWTAGSLQVYFPHFCLAALCRVPKIALFTLLSH
jgi:membrane protein YqaA with SNARE-associated domain